MTEYKYGDVLKDVHSGDSLMVMYISSAEDTSPYSGPQGTFLILNGDRGWMVHSFHVWALTGWEKIDG